MRNQLKKTLAGLTVVAIIVSVGIYTHHVPNKQLLSATAFEDISNLDEVVGVSMAPQGTITASAGQKITINSVYLQTEDGMGNVEIHIIDGQDLKNSPIYYGFLALDGSSEPQISQSVITLPGNFVAPHRIQIQSVFVQGSPLGSYNLDVPLTIQALPANFCSPLQTSFILPQGGGLDFPDPDDLPTQATTAGNPIDFGAVTPINTISFHYLHPDVPEIPEDPGPPLVLATPRPIPTNARTFNISVQAVLGLDQPAKLISSNAETGTIVAQIRDEGEGNAVGTRNNSIHLFNTILGVQSPFVASAGSNSTLHLTTKERGLHANDYYMILNNGVGTQPFSGGAAGVADVLVTPNILNNVLLQGQTNLTYVQDGVGPYKWASSNPSVVELENFDAQGGGGQTISFNPVALTDNAMWDSNSANITVDNCEDYASGGGGGGGGIVIADSRDCDVEISNLVVTYDISANTYNVQVATSEGIVDIPNAAGTTLTGTLQGSGRWAHDEGIILELTGTVEGNISGTAEGGFSGNVSGTIRSNIEVTLNIASVDPNFVGAATIYNNGILSLVHGDFTAGLLTTVPGSFISDIGTAGAAAISPFVLAHSKQAGNTILSVVDANQCVAAIDVTVSAMKLILQRENQDTLDPGDSFNINAYVGWDNGEVDYNQNVSASPGIEWFSSNPAVATVDGTGSVTILAPGNTNITARYDTKIPEVGTVESDALPIEVASVTGLTIGLDEIAQTKVSQATLNKALKLVTINIHSPKVVGSSLMVEGFNIPIGYASSPETLENDQERLADIATQLAADLTNINNSSGDPALIVNTLPGMVGVLTVQPQNQNTDHNGNGIKDLDENGIIDIVSNASSKSLTLLPQFTNLVNLSAFETYSLMVLAGLSDGRTRRLSSTDSNVAWVNTPANYLDGPSLKGGLIKLGDTAGTSAVKAQYNGVNGASILSNSLTVVVENGPSIDSIMRIGSGPMLKGMRTWWQAQISDIDGIASLASIKTYLVSSSFNTYQGIISDPNATWFTVKTALENIVNHQEDAEPVAEPPAEGEPEGETPPPAAEEIENNIVFNFFDIPIDIPLSQNLFNGPYKLVFSLADNTGKFTHYVIAINIGDIISGDANGDGVRNFLDVITIFKIIKGSITPSSAQANAADVNNDGIVNFADLILVFQMALTK